jgi:hypothetical protein
MSHSKEFRGEFPVGHVAKRGERRGSGWCKVLLLVRGIPQYQSNSVYKVGRYYYETDESYARVVYAYGYLAFGAPDRHPSQQTAVGKMVYAYGDAGGHLFAREFDGSGHAINMVPMNSYVNHPGAWREMERDFERLLRGGKKVFVAITLHYEGSSLRPSSFSVVCVAFSRSRSHVYRYDIANPRP